MKKRHNLFLLLLVLSIGYLSAQTLTVRIENADIGRGYLMVGIFNEEGFPDNYYKGEKVAVSNEITVVVFDNLPVGKYAISVYQDSNNNGQLDRNIFGIPKEKYGFSNGARRPNFNDCVFDFSSDKTITIRIR